MATRRLLIDAGFGEDRGVVLLDGRPERLLLDRYDPAAGGPESGWLHGEALTARVVRIERGLGMAFLSCGAGSPELTASAAGLVEGAMVSARVVAPARDGKLTTARVEGAAGALETLGRTSPRPTLAQRLQAFAPAARIERGAAAREAADIAQTQVFTTEHPLPGGARLSVEPTRALIAVDVDVGGASAGRDAKQARRAANMAALRETARLLRLKGLGGNVVIDLAGQGHDGPALTRAAREAFAPDEPGVAFGAISRFGLFELQLPRRETPLAERLGDADGRLSPLTLALSLLRLIEAQAGPAGRVTARCAPETAAAAQALAPRLMERIGARFSIVALADIPPGAPRLDPA